MIYRDAYRRVVERTQAVVGTPSDADAEPRLAQVYAPPEELCRHLLLGLVEPEEVEELLMATEGITNNAARLLMRAPSMDSQMASLAFLFTQHMATGLLMGRGRAA